MLALWFLVLIGLLGIFLPWGGIFEFVVVCWCYLRQGGSSEGELGG